MKLEKGIVQLRFSGVPDVVAVMSDLSAGGCLCRVFFDGTDLEFMQIWKKVVVPGRLLEMLVTEPPELCNLQVDAAEVRWVREINATSFEFGVLFVSLPATSKDLLDNALLNMASTRLRPKGAVPGGVMIPTEPAADVAPSAPPVTRTNPYVVSPSGRLKAMPKQPVGPVLERTPPTPAQALEPVRPAPAAQLPAAKSGAFEPANFGGFGPSPRPSPARGVSVPPQPPAENIVGPELLEEPPVLKLPPVIRQRASGPPPSPADFSADAPRPAVPSSSVALPRIPAAGSSAAAPRVPAAASSSSTPRTPAGSSAGMPRVPSAATPPGSSSSLPRVPFENSVPAPQIMQRRSPDLAGAVERQSRQKAALWTVYTFCDRHQVPFTDTTYQGSTMDISEGGFMVEGPAPDFCEPKNLVVLQANMKVVVKTDNGDCAALCRVCNVTPAGDLWQFGLQILEIGEKDRKVLREMYIRAGLTRMMRRLR